MSALQEAKSVITSPSRHGFALLTYALTVVMLGATLPTPMYELYGERMQFSVLTTTVIFATYAVSVLAALLFFGRWSDVIGRRPMLLAGAVLAIVSSGVFLFADSVTVLLVGRVLSGLSAGIYTGTATAAIIEAASPAWRPGPLPLPRWPTSAAWGSVHWSPASSCSTPPRPWT